MKLRLDLLKYITAEDLIAEAGATVDRYKPEPLFAKTGKGYLRPATPEEKEEEMRRSEAWLARVKARAEADKQRQRQPEQS
ncbi:MAG: hypothetical protein WCS99_00755 [Limisphaerales bacterium]